MKQINFYLLYGSDKAILNKEIDNFKKKLSISDDSVIYYDIDNIFDIFDEASTMGMFSLNKLIIIDATNYLTGKNNILNIEVLEDYFNNFNVNSYLLFICNSDNIDSRKKLVKLISAKGEVKKIEPTREYLTDYVINYLKDNGYSCDNYVISLFLDRSGNNIYNITNELDKIMLYKINDKKITKDDVMLLTNENIDDTVYSLVNCILKNDNVKAIKLYNNFKDNGMDDSQIVAVIAAQIRLLFQVKRLYNSGKSNDEIAKILEFKSVYRVKYLLGDSYYYTEEDLLKYLSKLADIDRRIKLSNNSDIFLELFIAQKDM